MSADAVRAPSGIVTFLFTDVEGSTRVRPITLASSPELSTAIAHLREVLGDRAYKSHARAGASMTTTGIANYTFHQIGQARTELEQAR